jgi:DivIVA domain-containing protein
VIDESFHLTPLDVRRTEFAGALRGYDKARVDEFRDRVANELERLTRINQELDSKAKGFHEQLRAFRERDKALNEALVSAQQLRAETRDQAEREAQLVLREAKAEGERLVEAARGEVRRLASEIEGLERARRAYLAQFRDMVARQLAELDAIPATPAVAVKAPASEASPNGAGDEKDKSADKASDKTVDKTVDKTSDKVGDKTKSKTAAPLESPTTSAPPPPPPGLEGQPGAERAGEPTTGGNRISVQTPAWLNVVPKE